MSLISLFTLLIAVAAFLFSPSRPSPIVQEPLVNDETSSWNRYENRLGGFSLRYPAGWRYREFSDGKVRVEFLPAAAWPQEAELEPKIILEATPLATSRGSNETFDEWFESEVVNNVERFDAKRDVLGGNPFYTFSEGVGEYPHEKAVLVAGDTVYWFTIEASAPEMHKIFKLLPQTLQSFF